jgi:hypothetical protein
VFSAGKFGRGERTILLMVDEVVRGKRRNGLVRRASRTFGKITTLRTDAQGDVTMTLTLEITPELEQALQANAQRAGLPPDRYVINLLQERLIPANGAPVGLPPAEAALLERINEALPEATWARYDALREERDAGTLTDTEYAELLELVNEVEIWNARRLEAVAELAKLRGVRFPDLVKQLGLGAPARA